MLVCLIQLPHKEQAEMWLKLAILFSISSIDAFFGVMKPWERRNSFVFMSDTIENVPSNTLMTDISLVTFNILAPCYKRIKPSVKTTTDMVVACPQPTIFESEYEELFIPRNEAICDQLLQSNADIICLQEFWAGNSRLQQIYIDKLVNSNKYLIKTLERTSHWRSRNDGLAMLVKKDKFVIEDVKEILFHDCGDRVALMLLLSTTPTSLPLTEDCLLNIPPQRFLVVNTHLLFPHNEYSTKIRLREVTKLLGFVESYKQRELCSTVCGRADVRIPVLIAGDFNGSPRGSVYQYMKSQNFRSALEEDCNKATTSTTAATAEGQQLSACLIDRWDRWISHRSHRGVNVAVDHVFYLNPSEQTADRLPPLPDWTNLVYFELMQRLITIHGAYNMRDIFSAFDQDSSNFITREEFELALGKLGFLGENAAALTKDEIDVLIASADKNEDGMIDYKEFYDRFWLAAEMLMTTATTDPAAIAEDPGVAAALTTPTSPLSASAMNSLANMTALEGSKRMGVLLNSRRFAFARSKWLSRKLSPNSNTNNNNPSADLDLFIKPDLLPDAVPLGDMTVQSVKLLPEELETGNWPDDYLLSDHGMVQCNFQAVINTNSSMAAGSLLDELYMDDESMLQNA